MIKVPSVWQHTGSKNYYRVRDLVLRENDLETMVVYENCETLLRFSRPLKEFLGEFPSGKSRFKFIRNGK